MDWEILGRGVVGVQAIGVETMGVEVTRVTLEFGEIIDREAFDDDSRLNEIDESNASLQNTSSSFELS